MSIPRDIFVEIAGQGLYETAGDPQLRAARGVKKGGGGEKNRKGRSETADAWIYLGLVRGVVHGQEAKGSNSSVSMSLLANSDELYHRPIGKRRGSRGGEKQTNKAGKIPCK